MPAFILNGFAILLIIIDYTKLSKTKFIYPLQKYLLIQKLPSIACLPIKFKAATPGYTGAFLPANSFYCFSENIF
jgi:hypothetical protein